MAKIIPFLIWKPARNRAFLYQKYIVEKLFTAEIARLAFASRPTILKYLKLYGIPIRGTGENIRRQRGLSYGRRIVKRQEVIHKSEEVLIDKIRKLREKGWSYWKIADILNALGISTKTKSGRWHAKTVQKILQS